VLNSDKHWWPQAEAVVGFLNAWQIGGKQAHLDAALRAWEFIEAKIIDKDKGEWFAILNHEGTPYPDYPAYADSQKIGPWKCPYHNARACFEVIKRVK
jgi:cellobiose epimerase